MSLFQATARKRGRDDDSDSEEERYMKKLRPGFSDQFNNSGYTQLPLSSNLPHRPSHTPSPPRLLTDIRSMTPAQSDYGGANTPESIYGGPVCISRESSKMDYDMEMDEDDARSQPPESPAFGSMGNFMRPAMLQPTLFNSDSANSSGRIPTPIHPTFKRGSMSGLGYPMSGSAGGLNMSNQSISSLSAPPIWKGPRQDMEDERSRRMPSPISEDDDIPDTPTALTQSQLSRLSFSHANTADQMMDTGSSTNLGTPPTPRGRKRSGALTSMGRFSMGYRDDCEKCRQRVPGHYSHFLP